ncbi:MAG: hypothetical protein HY606_04525 [Planctomycetes bacterium]|nr:hypothetical protein [Planctomycetota bacterium]
MAINALMTLFLLLPCGDDTFLSDFEEGLKKARQENKVLLVDFYHDW